MDNKAFFPAQEFRKVTYREQWIAEDDLPGPGEFRLTTSRNRLSPVDDFRQLVSSNPLFRFSKMTFWRHQIMEDDLAGPGRFQLVVSRNWLGTGKSSFVISLFPVSHLPRFTVLGKSPSGILGLGRMLYCPFYLFIFFMLLSDPYMTGLAVQYSLHAMLLSKVSPCLAQTRTGIGLLGKPPAVKQFPSSKANRSTRLLRDQRANAGMKRTSVVEHNLYFTGLAIVG